MQINLQAQPPAALASGRTPVLEYRNVSLRLTWPYDTALEDVSFAIHAGELLLITLEPGHVRSPFADLTQALRSPDAGHILVMGDAWDVMRPAAVAKRRFHMSRVFDVGGWISNLDVDENVLLAQLHYGTASAHDLRQRADALARRFGLPGIPRKRPASASQFELRLSQWVRALLGDVKLIVMERPTKDVRPEAIVPFMVAVDEARQRGTAVLWVTTAGAGPSTSHNFAPANVTSHLAVNGTKLVPVTREHQMQGNP